MSKFVIKRIDKPELAGCVYAMDGGWSRLEAARRFDTYLEAAKHVAASGATRLRIREVVVRKVRYESVGFANLYGGQPSNEPRGLTVANIWRDARTTRERDHGADEVAVELFRKVPA